MKNMLLLLAGMFLISVSVYSQTEVKKEKEKYVLLCDKAEKNKVIFLVNDKYCFVSSQEKNVMSLLGGEQIKEVAILTSDSKQKNKMEEYVNRFDLDNSNVQIVFLIQLKDSIELPQSLKKIWR